MNKLLILAAAIFAAPAPAATRYRVPLQMLDTQCANGRCYVTAYYDTNTSSSYRRDWACRAKTYNGHRGVDYGIGGWTAMNAGRNVKAAASGTVVAVHDGEYDRCSGGNCGSANYVKIRHADGAITWYWHLKKWSVRVRPGQWVSCGTIIGKVGSSGHSYGPHLHFGLQRAGSTTMIDPYGATSTSCGRTGSYWTDQNGWGGMPGYACQ